MTSPDEEAAMAELMTRSTDASVDDFIARIEGEERRANCRTLVEMMRCATGSEPVVWGPSIAGFGGYHDR